MSRIHVCSFNQLSVLLEWLLCERDSAHDHQEAGKEDQDEEDNDLNARQIQTERKLRDDSSGVLRRHIWQN